MKKSIAIIVCAWPPQGGGIGNNAYYQAKKFGQLGHRVGVFTPQFSGIQPADETYTLHKLKTFLKIGKAGFLIGLNRELKKYDVIHLDYPFFGTDLLIWYYKIINPGAKLFVHYKMDAVGQGLLSWIFWLYTKLFLGLIVRSADKIGVLSYDHAENSYLAPYLKKYSGKFVELPNGVDTEIFRPEAKKETLQKLNNISVQDKVVIFVGGLDAQHYFKGVPVLLEAFKKLPVNYFPNILDGEVRRGVLQDIRGEVKLLIVGDGSLRHEFENRAKELGIANRVIFTGWIKNEDLPQYYALADIFVLPSTASTECFGIVAAEAQACGVAAVLSDWPGVRTTIIEGETGYLVKPSDSDDLASKLKMLLNDDKLCREFGRAGRLNVVQKYDWQIVISRLVEIYNAL